MFVLTFVTFTLAYQILRADGAFKPGTYDASTAWITLSIVVSVISAIASGWVCAKIGKKPNAVIALLVVVVVLGLASAASMMAAPTVDPPPRTGDIAMFESMKHARQPVWLALLFPALGVAGVLIGARLAGQSTKPAPTTVAGA
jgi:hypothetical protein